MMATLDTFLTIEHADLNATYDDTTGSWALAVRNNEQAPSVSYPAEQALLYSGAPSRSTRPSGAAYDFLGVAAGADYYVLPQGQNPELLYLGFASSGVDPNLFDRYNPSAESNGRVSGLGKWLKFDLVSVVGPGHFSVWQNDLSGPNVLMASYDDGTANSGLSGIDETDGVSSNDSLWTIIGGHSHFNLGFSAPGRYEVTLRASAHRDTGGSAFEDDGNVIVSGDMTIYFSIVNVGQIEFDASTYTANENAGTATITARRVNGSDGQLTVHYAASNGTATATDDYGATSGTMTFADQETTKTFTIPIVNDLLSEGNETILLTLNSPGPSSISEYYQFIEGRGLLGSRATATLTIVDDEIPTNPPTLSSIANQQTNEDAPLGPISFVVGDNETPPGDLVVTASSSNQALISNAAISLGGSGANRNLTLHPNLNAFGSATITISVTDGGSTTAQEFLFTVLPQNDRPTITPISTQSIAVNGHTGDIPFTVGDVETPAGVLTVTAASSNATLIPASNIVLSGGGIDRTVAITPATNQFGSATITLTVTDSDGATSTSTFAVTVNAVNDKPVGVADLYQVTPGNIVRGNVLFNDADVDGDALSAILISGPTNGALTMNSNGTFTYVPGAAFNGLDTFSYAVSDGLGGMDTATVSISLAQVPDFQAVLSEGHVDVGIFAGSENTMIDHGDHSHAIEEDFGWDLHVHDGENDEEHHPDEALLLLRSESLSTRPASSAFDFIGLAAGQPYFHLPATQNPELLHLGIGTEEVEEGTFLGDRLTLRLKAVNGPGHFALWESGLLGPAVAMATSDGILAADQVEIQTGSHSHFNWAFTAAGRYEITFEAFGTLPDGTVVSSGDVTYYFAVNSAPQALDDRYTATRGTPLVVGAAGVLGNDSDADGNALTIIDFTQPASGLVSLAADGALTYTPAANFVGEIFFTYTVGDGFGGSDTATVTITINPANAAPMISNVANQSINEDTALTSVPFTVGDLETAAGSLLVTATSSNPSLVPNANITLGGAGANRTVSVLPVADRNGTTTITLTVTDSGGLIATDSFVVTVRAVNDAPTFALASTTVTGGAGPQAINNFATNFRPGPATATDEMPQSLLGYSVTVVATNGNLAFSVPPSIDNSGRLTYQAVSGTSGAATVEVTARDNGGTANGGIDTSAPLTFTIDSTQELLVLGTARNDVIMVSRQGVWIVVSVNGRRSLHQSATVGTFRIDGLGGNDRLEVSALLNIPVTLLGGAGDDVLLGGSADDLLRGGAGKDTLDGRNGNDLLIGEAGNDTFRGGNGDDFVFGGAGNDSASGGAGADQLFGEAGNDTLRGDSGDDLLFGEAGLDILYGGIGNDVVVGGEGNDSLFGDSGRDLVIGGGGGDWLSGGAEEDILVGGRTIYDIDPALLDQLLAAWTTPGVSYRDRSLQLAFGSGSNRVPPLGNAQITDTATDRFSGEAGLDLHLASRSDLLTLERIEYRFNFT